ncbi:hypothetical protein [uncultured Parabacteroides sp.]|uniref:hypothetical protein n=1 Tax=uncultured Parabacteroides sp. TaxID=512312 RepID=UPI0026581F3A|nr:hypothetical protein [uncultured Parabacteroides sp.]
MKWWNFINNGCNDIKEQASFFSRIFELRNEPATIPIWTSNVARTIAGHTFLDKMRERLNLRMQHDDEKERERRK